MNALVAAVVLAGVAAITVIAIRFYAHAVMANLALRDRTLKELYGALDDLLAYDLPDEALEQMQKCVTTVQDRESFESFSAVVRALVRSSKSGKRLSFGEGSIWHKDQPEHVRKRLNDFSRAYLVGLTTVAPIRGVIVRGLFFGLVNDMAREGATTKVADRVSHGDSHDHAGGGMVPAAA